MPCLFSKYLKYTFLYALFMAVIPYTVFAQDFKQTAQEVKVPILKDLRDREHWSTRDANGVIDEKTFKELLTKEENSFLKELEVNFSTQTLIAVTMMGDCHIQVSVNITRDDKAKKYFCYITEIYGGCRAAGFFQNWLVIEKMLPEYTIEFSVIKKEKR
jgi:hypothetical protein